MDTQSKTLNQMWNNTLAIYIGNVILHIITMVFNGYMAEDTSYRWHYISTYRFGEFDEDSGIWKPKAYTGSYGAQGFYLPFDDSSNLGTNANGNDVNDLHCNNIAAADQATDTPTNNFCTWNAFVAFPKVAAIRKVVQKQMQLVMLVHGEEQKALWEFHR